MVKGFFLLKITSIMIFKVIIMNSKNGFTLIELVMVIALIAFITTIIGTNLLGMKAKQKERAYERLTAETIDAGRVYVGLNKNDSKVKAKEGSLSITLEELIAAGYLGEESLVDPRNNQNIPLTNKLIVVYDVDSQEFSYKYNYD